MNLTAKLEAELAAAIEELESSLRGELEGYTSFGFIRGASGFARRPRNPEAARIQRDHEVAKIRSLVRAIRLLRAAELRDAEEKRR